MRYRLSIPTRRCRMWSGKELQRFELCTIQHVRHRKTYIYKIRSQVSCSILWRVGTFSKFLIDITRKKENKDRFYESPFLKKIKKIKTKKLIFDDESNI